MVSARSLLLDRSGAALVEFTVVASLFFFVLFAAVEVGFMVIWWNQTEKAVQAAGRWLIVRPALVATVPETRGKNAGLDPTTIRYGELCGVDPATTPCAVVAAASCTIDVAGGTTTCDDAAGATAVLDLMRGISPLALMNGNAGTITVTYADSEVGFVGGPYVPVVTVSAADLRYEYVAMSGLSALLGGDGAAEFAMPTIGATLLGEDLNLGTSG